MFSVLASLNVFQHSDFWTIICIKNVLKLCIPVQNSLRPKKEINVGITPFARTTQNENGFFYAYLRGLLKRNLFHLSGAKSN